MQDLQIESCNLSAEVIGTFDVFLEYLQFHIVDDIITHGLNTPVEHPVPSRYPYSTTLMVLLIENSTHGRPAIVKSG